MIGHIFVNFFIIYSLLTVEYISWKRVFNTCSKHSLTEHHNAHYHHFRFNDKLTFSNESTIFDWCNVIEPLDVVEKETIYMEMSTFVENKWHLFPKQHRNCSNTHFMREILINVVFCLFHVIIFAPTF